MTRSRTLLPLAFVTAASLASSAGSQPGVEVASYVVDHESSYLLAVVGVAGVLSSFAEEHAVLATAGSAEICLADDDLSGARVTFSVPTRSLRIDTQRARDLAGLKSATPDEDTRRELQQKMVSDRFLAVDRYDTLAFASRSVSISGGGDLWIEGDLTLRGRTNRVAFPVQLERLDDDALYLRGGVTVKQTDFGMEPESIAGVVKVADAVDVRFEILARPDEGDCATRALAQSP